MIFFDTESVGFYGPTVLIQYAYDNDEPTLLNVFETPVWETLRLIEDMVTHKEGIVGFNLSHDMFHLCRTYGVLKQLPVMGKPQILDYYDVEKDDACRDNYCLKPVTALDLMLHGRKGEFQSTLNQKDIIIRRVPKVLAPLLLKELQKNVKIPDIYFSKSRKGCNWRIIELHRYSGKEVTPEEYSKANSGEIEIEIDQHLVNIRLSFNPSTALKIIMEKVLGHDVFTLDDLPPVSKPKEFGWWPCSGQWIDDIKGHLWEWTNNPRRIEYARNDVIYTRELYNYFGRPDCGDDDSVLACAVGAMYWRGFSFDPAKARERLLDVEGNIKSVPVNIDSPRQVLGYIHECCDDVEKLAIPNTAKDTLHSLLEWKDENPKVVGRVESIIAARQAAKEKDLLTKILKAGRFYATYKVIGTKSNRMSGGSESYLRRGGSINPQGIKKGSGIRSIFTLAPLGMSLCGGDFSGFEVAIVEAVYNDPDLRKDLLTGKKIHGLFGASLYKMEYEAVMLTEDINENDPNGFYSRAKKAFFAKLYGAQEKKIGDVTWLEEEEVYQAFQDFEARYPGIKENRERIFKDFAALRQDGGIGTQVTWHEPKRYIESFLGFRRYFDMEFSVVKALFNMATEPSDEMKALGKGLKIRRRDRIQTAGGACASATYAAAFNIQSQIMRIAANHEIQSPGGQITKTLQRNIWELQPSGVSIWLVMPMNVHDEIECPCHPSVVDKVEAVVNETVESYRADVPLIKMKWKKNINSWGEK